MGTASHTVFLTLQSCRVPASFRDALFAACKSAKLSVLDFLLKAAAEKMRLDTEHVIALPCSAEDHALIARAAEQSGMETPELVQRAARHVASGLVHQEAA